MLGFAKRLKSLLPAEKPGAVNERGIVATGFLALGPKPLAQQDRVKAIYDVVDEQMAQEIGGALGNACAERPVYC